MWRKNDKYDVCSRNLRTPSFRVDPTVRTETVKETPIELAAKKESTELMNLFAEFVDLPPEIKIKLN